MVDLSAKIASYVTGIFTNFIKSRMKKLILIFSLFLLNSYSFGQYQYKELNYDLKFGFIKGGEANFTTCDTIIDNNYQLYIRLHGYTVGLTNILYGVNNEYESFVDSVVFLPVKTNKNLHEQNYRFNNEVWFNDESDSAFSEKSGWHQVEDGICDVVSMMYHLRFSGKLDSLKVDDIISLPFWDTDSWYFLKMKYKGNEIVKTQTGKHLCMRIEPIMQPTKLFDKGNPINIWFTNDDQKLPVLMELNFRIGSVKCELKNT